MTRILTTLLLFCGGPFAYAGDWPQFRGPEGLGVSSDKELPVEVGPDPPDVPADRPENQDGEPGLDGELRESFPVRPGHSRCVLRTPDGRRPGPVMIREEARSTSISKKARSEVTREPVLMQN